MNAGAPPSPRTRPAHATWPAGHDHGHGDRADRRPSRAALGGSLSGTGDIRLGATVDGPSAPASFAGLNTVTGMRACHAGNFRLFNTKAAAYEDNVVSWPSVEPAGDYTAASLLAFAFAGQDGG